MSAAKPPKHEGSCHCGALSFTLDAALEEAIECNCTICRKKGYILSFVPARALTLTGPNRTLKSYTFNTHNIEHQFCSKCGCSPFGHGTGPDGSKMASINIRCISTIDLNAITITPFDGASL